MLLEQDYQKKAQEIIGRVKALQLESSVKSWKDAVRLIPVIIKAVEVEAWTGGEYEKKKLAIAIANELIDIPFVPENAEAVVFDAMIDFAIGLLNQLFGQNWIERVIR